MDVRSVATPPRLRPPEATRYLADKHGVITTTGNLNKLRCIGNGPEFEHFGRQVYYRPEALDRWVEGRFSSTMAA
jgi:hypothetical protein